MKINLTKKDIVYLNILNQVCKYKLLEPGVGDKYAKEIIDKWHKDNIGFVAYGIDLMDKIKKQQEVKK